MIHTGSYFIFNGINSREYDIVVEKQPDIIRAQRRVSEFTAPGRSGRILRDEAAFENTTKTAECLLMTTRYINNIAAWLTGAGEVVFSSEKAMVYDAFIKNAIPFSQVISFGFKRFIVQFDCQPFKRGVYPERDTLVLTSPGGFMGQGTWEAEPVITVFGDGDISLDINGQAVLLFDVSEAITINSAIMDCYKNNENQNFKMSGEFPVLSPVSNSIDWSGNVIKVVVEPGWRWL